MPTELKNLSAVIVARDLNLSIFKPLWLCRHDILSEDELGGNIVITPALIRIPADSFELLIVPDRLQIRPSLTSESAQADVLRVVGGIVSTLPHTPFTAIGLNFDHLILNPSGSEFRRWHQAKFAAPYALDAAARADGDPRFGAYFSFDALNMRLKVDAKPVNWQDDTGEDMGAPQPTREGIVVKFNFHRDLTQPPRVSEVLEVLGRWEAAASFAGQLAGAASR